MNEKHQFIVPAIIFTIVVSIVGGFFVTQAQVAWLRSAAVSGEPALKVDGRAEIAGGAILNTSGATNGLLVPNGNVGIGAAAPGWKLNVEGGGTGGIRSSTAGSNIGVYGSSIDAEGVHGGSTNGVGVYGNGGGQGVFGYSPTGTGVYGQSGVSTGNAGYFDGNVKVTGDIKSYATFRYMNGPPSSVDGLWEFEIDKYIIAAGPSWVGIPISITYDNIYKLCGDIDGCTVTLVMADWIMTRLGVSASRSAKLSLSTSSGGDPSLTNWWRWNQYDPYDYDGLNNDNAVHEVSAWDCYFGDFDTGTGNNVRTDNNSNFGLLNATGGSYSDTITTCRLIIED